MHAVHQHRLPGSQRCPGAIITHINDSRHARSARRIAGTAIDSAQEPAPNGRMTTRRTRVADAPTDVSAARSESRVARPRVGQAAGAATSVAELIDLAGHPGLLVRPAAARALYVLAPGAGAGKRHVFLAAVAGALAAREVATLRWEFPYMAAGKPRPDRAEGRRGGGARGMEHAARARFGELAMFAGGRVVRRADDVAGPPRPRRSTSCAASSSSGFRSIHPTFRDRERAEHRRGGGPLLFVQGDRDELAGLRRLRPVVARLGGRATLRVVKAADHGFEVQVRSGRTPSDVLDEIADTVAAWITVHAARR
jgi:predicted alpha/beta-hydrolase family hydrolase